MISKITRGRFRFHCNRLPRKKASSTIFSWMLLISSLMFQVKIIFRGNCVKMSFDTSFGNRSRYNKINS
jgi:hypothetical protein